MPLRPTFGRLSVDEAQALLFGLWQVNRYQLGRGVPGVLARLRPGADPVTGKRILVYQRHDPNEHWRSVREIHHYGGGDCEDLAAAGAAELTEHFGILAVPYVYRVKPGLAHVVIKRADTGEILDPSKLGGMGETKHGGREVVEGRGIRPEVLARLGYSSGMPGCGGELFGCGGGACQCR